MDCCQYRELADRSLCSASNAWDCQPEWLTGNSSRPSSQQRRKYRIHHLNSDRGFLANESSDSSSLRGSVVVDIGPRTRSVSPKRSGERRDEDSDSLPRSIHPNRMARTETFRQPDSRRRGRRWRGCPPQFSLCNQVVRTRYHKGSCDRRACADGSRFEDVRYVIDARSTFRHDDLPISVSSPCNAFEGDSTCPDQGMYTHT